MVSPIQLTYTTATRKVEEGSRDEGEQLTKEESDAP